MLENLHTMVTNKDVRIEDKERGKLNVVSLMIAGQEEKETGRRVKKTGCNLICTVNDVIRVSATSQTSAGVSHRPGPGHYSRILLENHAEVALFGRFLVILWNQKEFKA